MILLTININPPDKCARRVRKEINTLGDEERANRIITLIQNINPDIIFFIEQYDTVFYKVEADLKKGIKVNSAKENDEIIKYEMAYPEGFKPSNEKNAFAGVVAAIKSEYTYNSSDGERYVNETAKFLCIVIDKIKYLGVHYPQPLSYNRRVDIREEFHKGVLNFIGKQKPMVVIGDFNPSEGEIVTFDGYRDCLPENKVTSAFNKKLDYIFLQESTSGITGSLFDYTSEEKSDKLKLFSDHSETVITITL